jgi:hypothetical protein
MDKLTNESYGDYFQRIGDMGNKMKPAYIVKYSTGDWDEYRVCVFITYNEDTAKRWVEKFNRIRDNWLTYYQYITLEFDGEDSDYAYRIWNRYNQITELGKAWYEEIEVR